MGTHKKNLSKKFVMRNLLNLVQKFHGNL